MGRAHPARSPVPGGVNLGATIKEAVSHYVSDVRGGAFPSDAESFTVAENKAAPAHVEPALYSTAGKKK